jgi:hypothetical protein
MRKRRFVSRHRFGGTLTRLSAAVVAAVAITGSLTGCTMVGETCVPRNLGAYVGSTSHYPDYTTTGGYYTPSYKSGGPRCFGYTPAYIPGCYPGIYGGWEHFRKGESGCDINAPVIDDCE